MNHLHTSLSGTDLSPLQRKRLVNRLRINIPTHQQALMALEECLEESSYSAEPMSIFIGGDSGMGKSTLVKEFQSRYPRERREEVDYIPVLAASLPSVATTKSAASSLLRKLGDPKAFNGELAKLTDRLLTYLEACQTRMIVIDEFQHVIDRDSSKVRASTADWLKMIINEAQIPIALLGIPSAAKILDENIQLDRRFDQRMVLERFSYETSEARAAFRVLLKLIDENLPFSLTAGLDDPRSADWLCNRSKGLLGPVMNIIRVAAKMAIDDGSVQIQQEHLESAWKRNKSKLLRLESEVFETKPKRGRSRKGPNLGDLLRP